MSESKPRYSRNSDLLEIAFAMATRTGGITIRDIQDDYKVSRSTAERMRDSLLNIFPQIEEIEMMDNRKHYIMRPNFLLPLLNVSIKEITDLINCSSQTYIEELQQELKVLTDKLTFIRKRVDKEADEQIENQLQMEGFAVKQHPQHPVSTEVLKEVRRAFQENRKISFIYRKGEYTSKRNVAPLGIIYGEYRPYLIAYEYNRKKSIKKNFKLDKISDVKILDEYFDREGFNLQEHLYNCFTCYQGEVYNVKLLFWGSAAEDASEYMFHPSQKGKWNEEHTEYLVKFKASGLKDIIWCVFRWGNECKIVSPKPVRLFYQRYMRKILRLYK